MIRIASQQYQLVTYNNYIFVVWVGSVQLYTATMKVCITYVFTYIRRLQMLDKYTTFKRLVPTQLLDKMISGPPKSAKCYHHITIIILIIIILTRSYVSMYSNIIIIPSYYRQALVYVHMHTKLS